MKLGDYLKSKDALSVRDLSNALGCAPAQVWQWVTAEQATPVDRRPGAAYCVAIEAATKERVRRWDLRPHDWHRIWPELIGSEGAPELEPEKAA